MMVVMLEQVAQRACRVYIWRYSKPDWIQYWAIRCSQPCFEEVVLGLRMISGGLFQPQQSCDSVIIQRDAIITNLLGNNEVSFLTLSFYLSNKIVIRWHRK